MGDWPDSVQMTHIVMFKDPLLEAADFNALNLRYVSELIPYGSESYTFNTLDNILFGNVTPDTYAYLAVAQSNSATLSLNRADWTVAGLYFAEGDSTKAGTITIPENKLITNINIICDFNNPPPQPPGGPGL